MMSLVLWFLGAVLLVACTATVQPSTLESTPLTLNATATPTMEVQPGETNIPALELEPSAVSLVVWLPDTILPPDNLQISDMILAQMDSYDASEPLIDVRVRRKKAQDAGSILATLRAASAVAPSALPDIALIRREELLLAVQNRLVQPIDELMSAQILADMYPSANQIGIVNGQMYGAPYLIEALVLASNVPFESPPTFDRFHQQEATFAFPAGRLTGLINDTLFLQYLSAGGQRPQGEDANLILSAVESVLNFYEEMRQDSLVDARILEYASSAEYQSNLLDKTLDSGIVSTTTYLRLIAQQPDLTLSAIPTADGEPTTVLSGWVWVVVTSNAERQEHAVALIEWLLAAERQREVTSTLGILPSQRSVLRAGWRDTLDVALLDQMLINGVLPAAPDNGELALLQLAFSSVMSGEQTAREALDKILEQQPRE